MVSLGTLLAVTVLCVGIQARWPAKQGLDTDLDSLLCSPRNYPSVIIDIHESMDKGAQLMDGIWTESVSACVSGCCNTRSCDLALFKNEGTSKTGKNCYYVRCGKMENCVMVQHTSFTTISFMKADTRAGSIRTGHDPTSDDSADKPSTTSSTDPVTLPPSTTATPTTTQPPALPATTAAAEQETERPTTLAPSDGNPLSSEATHSNISKDGTQQVPGSTGGQQSGGNSPGKAKAENTDECSKYGCDGSGMVAVVVVGVVCFAIVLVVVAILMKKVVDDRRKRKFRNVDYLINGMYT